MGNKHSRRGEGEEHRASYGRAGEKINPPPTPKRPRIEFNVDDVDEVCKPIVYMQLRFAVIERMFGGYLSDRAYFEQYARDYPAFRQSEHYECRDATFPRDDYVVATTMGAMETYKENVRVMEELRTLRHAEGTVFSIAHVDALLRAREQAECALETSGLYLSVLPRMAHSMRLAVADFTGVDRRSDPLQAYINQCRAGVRVVAAGGI